MATLVLNMGLKSIRSIIFDEKGNKLSFASLPIETKLKGNSVTQSPLEWWNKAIQVIKLSLEDEVRERVQFITVTSSSSCLIPVTESGDSLCDAIMVSDKRATVESDFIEEQIEFREVFKNTGLPSDPYLMLPKILWLKNNESKVYNSASYFLSPNDFFVYKLTGFCCTDELNAQKYHYDIESKSYPSPLLKKLEIPIEKLPKVYTPGVIVGQLINKMSEEFGFKQDVKIVLSTYDAICAFIGSGPKGTREACDVSGTVTSLRIFSDNKVHDNKGRILNTPFTNSKMHIVGGSNNLGGGLIEWVKQCYYINEKYPYEIMEMEAKQSTEGAKGLIFLPYLMGERAPLWDTDARGVYFGIERFHTRKDMTRAVFESAGYTIRSMIDVMNEHNITVESIRVSGGLSRIQLISQIKADITGKNVVVVDEFETTALGAAIIAWIGIGVYSSVFDASEECIKERMIILPNKQNHELYNEMYGLFKESYSSLKKLFKRRTQIVKSIYNEKHETVENL